MSNICHSILEKLTALNIDIYHYEDVVRCYALAKLNIEHSGNPTMTAPLFSRFAVSLSRQVWIKIADCFLKPALPSWLLIGIRLCLNSQKDIMKN